MNFSNNLRRSTREPCFSSKSTKLSLNRSCIRPYSTHHSKTETKFGSSGPISWKSLVVFLTAGFGIYLYVRNEKLKMKLAETESLKKGRGRARLGGPFELTNVETGKLITNKDLLGNWQLLYFGFTFCPDICPDELDKMTEVINILDSKSGTKNTVQPVFISIDPKRDTVPQVKEYIKDFHPRFLGLTGTQEQVDDAARNYRVYYTISQTSDDPNDYLVDHSIIMYFLDPEGNFIQYYGQNRTAQEVADDIEKHILYKASLA
eukprot:Nk52_evm29s1178 gene=Nk52_evmTU29s1178